MSEIQRWEFGFSQMNEHDQGEFITWNDHVAALKAARNELPDVGSWTPEPKVGDRVRNDMFIGTVTSIETYDDQEDEFWVAWDEGGQSQCDPRTLTLYVAPTPAELIPTLKEHEWVRGTYKSTGIAFGPYTVYYNEIGAMFAGDNNLIHWNNGAISDELATIERCDAPVVK
jgi:hypothetical protein